MNWENGIPHLVFKNKDGKTVGDIPITFIPEWEDFSSFECKKKPDNSLYCDGRLVPVGNKNFSKERGAYIFDFDF